MERRLAAILLTDMVGYSRLMGLDEEGTISRQRAHRAEVFDPTISRYGGRVVKSTGDGLLIEFPSIVDAVKCAIEAQTELVEGNADVPEEMQVKYRIGINLGDIVIDGEDILGDGVNVAARLEGLAKPGGICISGMVHDQLAGKVDIDFEDLGEQQVKNVPRPVRVWQWQPRAASETGFRATREPPDPTQATSLPLPDKPSIAVMAFANMSGDPDQEFFSDGISEDIITQLSKLRGLFVIARNSSFTYKGQSADVKRIGRELGARYILEGSVRKSGNRLRINSQLLDALSGANIWAERYDRQLTDIFELQDEITNTIVATIEPAINEAERDAARRKPPESIGCWEAYQRGMWHLLRRNGDDFLKAREFFRESCSLDPTFALPHAGLALVAFFQIAQGFASNEEEALKELMSESLNAVTLDPSEAMAHSALGLAYMKHGEFEKSISAHSISVELNPNSSFSHWASGFALNLATRHEEGLEHFETALRLSPKDPTTWSILTVMTSALYQLKRYDEAAERAYEATANQLTDSLWPYMHLAAALGQLGRETEAGAVLSELRLRQPDISISVIREWPLMVGRPSAMQEHTYEGLRKAGLPE